MLLYIHCKFIGLYCETRWFERTDCIAQFLDEYKNILKTLEDISRWKESSSSSRASSLLIAIKSSEFCIAIHSQNRMFQLCAPLARLFQKKTMNLIASSSMVDDLLKVSHLHSMTIFIYSSS